MGKLMTELKEKHPPEQGERGRRPQACCRTNQPKQRHPTTIRMIVFIGSADIPTTIIPTSLQMMADNIWKLGADCNKDLVIRTAIDYFKSHFVGQPMYKKWSPPEVRVQGRTKRARDFVSWMSSAPVISEKAHQVLGSLIADHCEVLPLIELRGTSYYAINVLRTIDCLNHADSDILYADDDPLHIIRISSYVLDMDKVIKDVPIFKIPDDFGAVFVQRHFVDAVIKHGLRGASFEDPSAEPFGKIIRGETLNVVPGLPE